MLGVQGLGGVMTSDSAGCRHSHVGLCYFGVRAVAFRGRVSFGVGCAGSEGRALLGRSFPRLVYRALAGWRHPTLLGAVFLHVCLHCFLVNKPTTGNRRENGAVLRMSFLTEVASCTHMPARRVGCKMDDDSLGLGAPARRVGCKRDGVSHSWCAGPWRGGDIQLCWEPLVCS